MLAIVMIMKIFLYMKKVNINLRTWTDGQTKQSHKVLFNWCWKVLKYKLRDLWNAKYTYYNFFQQVFKVRHKFNVRHNRYIFLMLYFTLRFFRTFLLCIHELLIQILKKRCMYICIFYYIYIAIFFFKFRFTMFMKIKL